MRFIAIPLVFFFAILANGCAAYSRDLAPYEPRIHNVKEGDFIDLENSAGGIYIEKISAEGISISRRNGYGRTKLSEGSNSMGNGELIKIVDFDPIKKTAIIEQTELDRRGIFNWSF